MIQFSIRKNQSGGVALLAALMLVAMIPIVIGLYTSLQDVQLKQLRSVRAQAVRSNARTFLTAILMQPSAYVCTPSGCSLDMDVLAPYQPTPSSGQASVPLADVYFDPYPPTLTLNGGTPGQPNTQTYRIESVLKYRQTGEPVPIGDLEFQLDIPREIIFSDLAVCPADKPLFIGFSAQGSTLKLNCVALPQCPSTTKKYISSVNLRTLEPTCTDLPGNLTCPVDKMATNIVLKGAATPPVWTCSDRLDPFSVFVVPPTPTTTTTTTVVITVPTTTSTTLVPPSSTSSTSTTLAIDCEQTLTGYTACLNSSGQIAACGSTGTHTEIYVITRPASTGGRACSAPQTIACNGDCCPYPFDTDPVTRACICPLPRVIFDSVTNQCLCPAGTTYQSSTNTCNCGPCQIVDTNGISCTSGFQGVVTTTATVNYTRTINGAPVGSGSFSCQYQSTGTQISPASPAVLTMNFTGCSTPISESCRNAMSRLQVTGSASYTSSNSNCSSVQILSVNNPGGDPVGVNAGNSLAIPSGFCSP